MSLVRLNLFFTKFITARKRSFGQGNIFIGVCQEFCSQGGYLLRGVPAPGGCSQGGVPAPQMGGACSCGGVPAPRGVPVPGGVPAPRGACSRRGCRWRPTQTTTAAGGTHPTGMHSY